MTLSRQKLAKPLSWENRSFPSSLRGTARAAVAAASAPAGQPLGSGAACCTLGHSGTGQVFPGVIPGPQPVSRGMQWISVNSTEQRFARNKARTTPRLEVSKTKAAR